LAQKVWLELHVRLHAELLQTYPAGQTVPQVPQLWLSVVVTAQMPEQFVCPVTQETAQALPEQTCPLGHTVPQNPQLWLSLLRTVQIPEQFVCPVTQETAQALPEQTCPLGHTLPQFPQ